MIRNYFKIAFRNLLRNKLYTTLNVVGLTFGIACFMLIGLYLFDELTFDQNHSKSSRIFRAIQNKTNTTETIKVAGSGYVVSEEAKKVIPEIEKVVRFNRLSRANIMNPENKNVFLETHVTASEDVFNVFDFEILTGSLTHALDEPYSIVLVEDLALKLFGTTQVVGKIIDFEWDQPFKITAVLKKLPKNSSLQFNALISEITLRNTEDFAQQPPNWLSDGFLTFFLLKENVNPDLTANKITDLVYKNAKIEAGNSIKYGLQNISDIHFSEDIKSNREGIAQGSLLYIKIFGLVALFVLLIACINYMNLTTARATNRSKEIGVRKAVGAFRSHLIYQFLTESFIVTSLSFMLAILVVNLILPSFNEFADKQLSFGFASDYRIWLYTILALLITGFVSGSYPAFMLSKFSPLLLLKSIKLNNRTDLSLRKVLVIFQFTISVVMLIGTIVIYKQVNFVNNKDLGFDKELLCVVDINSGKVRSNAEVIKSEFSKIPNVKDVSVTSRVPGEWKTIPTIKINPTTNINEPQTSFFLGVDENFIKTFEIELLKGKNFAGINDSSSIIINETAAKILNIKEPSDQILEIPERAMGGSFRPLPDNQVFRARVIGIVKDFHFQSLRDKIAPIVLGYQNNPVHSIDYFTARVSGEDIPSTLVQMEKTLTQIDPSHLLEYHFLDEQLARFYADDARRQTLLIWVALATVMIACLGLFGLATYAAEKRIKEIGIRKVLGASVVNLATLLSKDFLKLVLIANGIAFPIAWWATDKWLQEFAYHIEIQWWFFALAGTIAIIIALLTVSYQAIKAALINPVKSLKTE